MRRYLLLLCALFSVLVLSGNSWAYTINHNGSTIIYGESWDDPSMNIEELLANQFGPSLELTLVNGIDNEIEKWFGMGAFSIILEELAGYRNTTDF